MAKNKERNIKTTNYQKKQVSVHSNKVTPRMTTLNWMFWAELSEQMAYILDHLLVGIFTYCPIAPRPSGHFANVHLDKIVEKKYELVS